MAQCPKCNKVIPFGTVVSALFSPWDSSQSFDCPKCKGSLVPTRKTDYLVAWVPAVAMLLYVLTMSIVPDKWYFVIEWLFQALTASLFLSAVLLALAVATLAKFEAEAPPKKIYDPDRLD